MYQHNCIWKKRDGELKCGICKKRYVPLCPKIFGSSNEDFRNYSTIWSDFVCPPVIKPTSQKNVFDTQQDYNLPGYCSLCCGLKPYPGIDPTGSRTLCYCDMENYKGPEMTVTSSGELIPSSLYTKETRLVMMFEYTHQGKEVEVEVEGPTNYQQFLDAVADEDGEYRTRYPFLKEPEGNIRENYIAVEYIEE